MCHAGSKSESCCKGLPNNHHVQSAPRFYYKTTDSCHKRYTSAGCNVANGDRLRTQRCKRGRCYTKHDLSQL